MFQSYIRIALRNLIKSKLYSAINIIGLAVGTAVCIFIALFARHELSYDNFWDDSDRLYQLHATYYLAGRAPILTIGTPGLAKEALQQYFPEDIEATTRFFGSSPTLRYEEKTFSERFTWTDIETANMFAFEMIAGDLETTLKDNSSLAVSESFARKYFGNDDPIGKVLYVSLSSYERDYRINAVFKDLPENTIFAFEAIALIDEKDFAEQPWWFESWFYTATNTFFKLKEGANIEIINTGLRAMVEANVEVPSDISQTTAGDIVTLSTMAITDLHLNAKGVGQMKPVGDKTMLNIFIVIAVVVLFIAMSNFINLTTAKSTARAREVALRKVAGASRKQLMVQFLGESILIALIGLLLAIVLVELALPFYNNYIGLQLAFNLSDGMTGLLLIGLVAIVGIGGGVYPALVLSHFLPARVLKANKSAETSGSVKFRNALVLLQFSISIILIISTVTVYGQMMFVSSMDLGFKKDNMLVIHDVGRRGVSDKQQIVRQEILRIDGVKQASLSFSGPINGDDINEGVILNDDPERGPVTLGSMNVDHAFFKTYEIPIIAGRDYDAERVNEGTPSVEGASVDDILNGTIIINESAIKRFGYASPEEAIGKFVRARAGVIEGVGIDANMEIIGVIGDINFQTVRGSVRPEMYPLRNNHYDALTINFYGEPHTMVRQIQSVWNAINPSVAMEYQFIDDAIAHEFEQENALANLLAVFSTLAVLIAALGLYGLASFTAERRTKEIGIRKVMGARVFDIVQLLIWQFSKPVLLANLIAWPVAFYFSSKWLETFVYRIEAWVLAPICLAAGLLTILISWATVGGHSARVARTNPIKALRYE